MEIKYTIAERHEIYKKALENKSLIGNCTKILRVINDVDVDFDYCDVKENFHELYYFRPKDEISACAHWFEDEQAFSKYLEENTQHRETILEFCIEMTKPE